MAPTFAAGAFRWGAASAAFQTEGHTRADGRGPSKWDVYTHRDRITEAVVGRQYDADVAINAYDRNQYLGDIALMREAGFDAYRFSLSWPRILPAGTGAVNRAGLDHYRRFVDDLLAAGIAPVATLYHWDFPFALHERGGWHNRDSAGWFADYADVVFRALGDRVDAFITLNEPYIDLFMMDLIAGKVRAGVDEPTRHSSADFGRQAPAMHHMFLAHARAVAAHRAGGGAGMIGIALPLYPALPLDPDAPGDAAAARLLDALVNRWPLEATLRGTYPEEAIAALRRHNRDFAVPAADLAELAAATVDFIGVNYYSPAIVTRGADFPLGLRWGNDVTNPDPVPAFNGPVRPDELYRLLLRLRDEYGNVPTIVSENGAGFGAIDEAVVDGSVDDPLRADYIARHIAATLKARAEGCDVRGYLCWTLCDNFEWIQGYERRFGIVRVDFATQRRTPKRSFAVYRDIVATRGGPGSSVPHRTKA